MRIVLGIVVLAVGLGVLTHRNSKPAPAAPASSAPAPAVQPAAPREVSEHNWAKHSLDRAADVKRQVVQAQKENGTR